MGDLTGDTEAQAQFEDELYKAGYLEVEVDEQLFAQLDYEAGN